MPHYPHAKTLAGVAQRVHNTKRSFLFVSSALGKSVPAEPTAVISTANALAELIRAHLSGASVVVAYAETATGLGTQVAMHLDTPVVSTTRTFGDDAWLRFTEPHSHAAQHAIRHQFAPLEQASTIVLVDDEFSTGTTLRNTILAMLPKVRARRFVIASLIDARTSMSDQHMSDFAAEHNVQIIAVALDRIANHPNIETAHASLEAKVLTEGCVPDVVSLPSGLTSVADGLNVTQFSEWGTFVRQLARDIRGTTVSGRSSLKGFDPKASTLVLGTEEFLWPAQFLALMLEADTSSTTASPAAVVDEPDYPMRSGFSFTTPRGRRYAYNAEGYEQIIIFTDNVTSAPALVPAERAWCLALSREDEER